MYVEDISNQISDIRKHRKSRTRPSTFLGSAQRGQRFAQKFLEAGGAGLAFGFGYGGIGGALVVAEIDEGGLHVGFDAGGGCGSWLFGFDGHGFKFVFQLHNHALSRFASDARNFGETSEIAAADGGDEFLDVHTGKDFEGQARANTGGAKEKFEEMLFALGEKAVEREGVFADVSVDQERNLGVEFAKRGEGGKRNRDEIANAANIEDDLIGSFFEETAAEESDHRRKVLPPSVRLSTRVRDRG
jgi:hypothetical protein